MHAPLSPSTRAVSLSALSLQGSRAPVLLTLAGGSRPGSPSLAPGLGDGILAGLRGVDATPGSSHQRHAVRAAAAPLHDHVGELGRLNLGVVAPLDEVDDGQRGGPSRGAGALPGAGAAQGAGELQAVPGAAVRLEPRRLQDPVLRPRQLAEADVVFLPAAGGLPRRRLLPAVPRAPGQQGRNRNGRCNRKLGSGRNHPCC